MKKLVVSTFILYLMSISLYLKAGDNRAGILGILKHLPWNLTPVILDYMSLNYINNVSEVNNIHNDAINNDKTLEVLEKEFFKRAFLSHEAPIKQIISSSTDDQLRDWLGAFTDNQVLVESVMKRRLADSFYAHFYFNISQLMTKCKTYNPITKAIIQHEGWVDSAKFSADDRHVLTINSNVSINDTAKIYSLGKTVHGKQKPPLNMKGGSIRPTSAPMAEIW